MLEEEGKVTGIDGNYAFVAAQPTSACEGCSVKGVCHVLGGSGETVIKAVNDIGAKVGDKVTVAITSKTFFKASALVYLLPVFALIIGAASGKRLAISFDPGMPAELFSAVSGIIALVLSFFVVKALGKKISENRADQAIIIKVL